MQRILFIILLFLQSYIQTQQGGNLILIEKHPAKGFNYPYYLFIPGNITDDKELTLITEPNNSGFWFSLPPEEINETKLTYPVGTFDFQELFGKPFNAATFKEIPQFYFMGALDDNDAIPYEDAFDPPEREVIYKTLGREMQPLRWENCQRIYKTEGVNAQFSTYEGIGHEQPDKIKEDILEFFKQINHE